MATRDDASELFASQHEAACRQAGVAPVAWSAPKMTPRDWTALEQDERQRDAAHKALASLPLAWVPVSGCLECGSLHIGTEPVCPACRAADRNPTINLACLIGLAMLTK